jgi:hypothetical protein
MRREKKHNFCESHRWRYIPHLICPCIFFFSPSRFIGFFFYFSGRVAQLRDTREAEANQRQDELPIWGGCVSSAALRFLLDATLAGMVETLFPGFSIYCGSREGEEEAE